MEKPVKSSPLYLSPKWHIPAALVLVSAASAPIMSMLMPHAAKLQQAGRLGIAQYFMGLSAAVWLVSLLILLPRTHNVSRFKFVRLLGRLPLIVRYFVAAGIEVGLFWLGILMERVL